MGSGVYRTAEAGRVLGFYRGRLNELDWSQRADIGYLGPIMYARDNFTLIISELTPAHMRSLGTEPPGYVIVLFTTQ